MSHVTGGASPGFNRKMTMTKQATKTVNAVSIDVSFVASMVEYAQLQDDITDRKAKAETLRAGMVDALKASKDVTWKALGPKIKEALALIPNIDQIGALGVLKTCHEYKILPSTLNADRLRKAKNWTNWAGYTVPNTYGKVHTKEGAGQKAATPATPVTPVTPATPVTPVTPVTAPHGQNMDKAKPAPHGQNMDKAKPAPIASAKPEVPRVNVDGTETPIGTVEHWESLFRGFNGHGMTELFMKQLAGGLGIEHKALSTAWMTVHDDFIKEAEKILTAKKPK